MKRLGKVLILGLSFVLIYAYPVLAQQKEIEMAGLIIDQTRTKIGHDFFQSFSLFWEAPVIIENYTIRIDEKVDPRFGSWIVIEINANLVYRKLLKPSPEYIEATAKEAIVVSREFLFSLQEYERALQKEEGGGIY